MSFSFSISSKSNRNRSKKPSANLFDGDDRTTTTDDVSAVNYVREFNPEDVGIPADSKIKPIAPLPDTCRHIKYLKNLPNLPSISQSNGSDSGLQFELDPGCNPDSTDKAMGYGLNLRQGIEENDGLHDLDRRDLSDLERKKFKEDLEKLPDGPELTTDYEDVPVEGFGAALFAGYGWKEGMGIGRNASKDVKVYEIKKRVGRGGLGFCETEVNIKAIENGRVVQDKRNNVNEQTSFEIGKEMRIVSGIDIGMKGKVVEVKKREDVLILRLSKSGEKVKVRTKDVAELGSTQEEKCLRRLEDSKHKQDRVSKDSHPSRKRNREESKKMVSKRVNWLRNNIKVRIVSKELNGGRLFLKKGVVVDVVGPGICDISVDETKELIQGVEQELLETALPRRGGPVLILFGRYKGVCGSLLERDPEKEMGMVRDLNTHEILELPLDQIAEYTGDPSDIL